jgi:Arc/MetJ-type ribon-helix-helix transcriptional regulator
VTTEEPPDDYFGAVAEVVEAARRLDEAKRAEREAGEQHLKRYEEMRAAEKVLGEALERLKGTSPR